MGFQQLSNCPKCGKLFVKGARDVCPDCFKIEEEEYKLVTNYLKQRENRQATIYEVSDATGVAVKLITKFIRQGRISVEGLPNLGLPCEMCGQITRDSHICLDCRSKLTKKVENFVTIEEQRIEMDKHKVKDIGYMNLKKEEKQ